MNLWIFPFLPEPFPALRFSSLTLPYYFDFDGDNLKLANANNVIPIILGMNVADSDAESIIPMNNAIP